MFRTKAIVIRKQKIRDRSIRLCFLTEEYGKIYGWYKKKDCPIDIGSLCDIIIERKESTNIIHTIEWCWSPLQVSWKYKELFSYLEIVSILGFLSSENTPEKSIIDDYKAMTKSIDGHDTEKKLTLFLCRFMKKSGILSEALFWSSYELEKIYTYIDISPIDRVLYSEKVEHTLIPLIQTSLRHSLQSWNQTLTSSPSSHSAY